MATHVYALLVIALYFAAAGGLARPLLSGGKPLNRLSLSLASVAVLIHAGLLLSMHRGALDLRQEVVTGDAGEGRGIERVETDVEMGQP
ncbi:MAG: hypothetical protein ACTS5I_14365, partial [Rhodanobacter sp.]